MESASAQPIRDYKDLHVWQKGMELAKQVYVLANHFPSEEKFGLVSQMRRAAVSVPSNIAEGQARNTTGEFIQFFLLTDVQKMLKRLRQSLARA